MRSVLKVGSANAVVNIFSLLNGVLFIGFLSRNISIAEFASWTWINSSTALCAISDLYLLLYAQNLITREFAKGKRRFADFIFRYMFYLQLIFAGLLGIFILGIIQIFNAKGITLFTDRSVGILFGIALIVQLASQSLSIFGIYFGGRGDSDKANLFLLIKAVGQNLIYTIAFLCGANFFYSSILYFICGPLFLFLFYKKGETTYKPYKFRMTIKKLKWMLSYLWMRGNFAVWGALRVVDSIRNNIALVIGYFSLSSTALVDYVFVARLNTLMLVISTGLFNPLVPKILELKTKGSTKALSEIIAHVLLITLGIGAFYCASMGLLTERIVTIWSGRTIELKLVFIVSMTLSGVLQVLHTLMWNILLGLDDISALLKLSIVSVIVSTFMLLILLPSITELALPVAIIMGSATFFILGYFNVKKMLLS